MVRVKQIKANPDCVASITVRIRKTKAAVMQVGNKTHRVLSIYHRPSSDDLPPPEYLKE